MMISYYMMREGKIPERSHPSDAGLDVYLNMPDPVINIKVPPAMGEPAMRHGVLIEPGKNMKLPTGLKFGVPHGYMLQVMNRSGIASKMNLVVGAHCIDSGYSGEVFIDMHNIGTEPVFLANMTKIAQLVMVPVVSFVALQSRHEHSLYSMSPITISDRKSGGFGSTGNE